MLQEEANKNGTYQIFIHLDLPQAKTRIRDISEKEVERDRSPAQLLLQFAVCYIKIFLTPGNSDHTCSTFLEESFGDCITCIL